MKKNILYIAALMLLMISVNVECGRDFYKEPDEVHPTGIFQVSDKQRQLRLKTLLLNAETYFNARQLDLAAGKYKELKDQGPGVIVAAHIDRRQKEITTLLADHAKDQTKKEEAE
ncbi:hypothetical protein HOM50_01780 [bacterium]|jgi:hypothetical protein|nr:hypothetical protein [bacterium]MBT5015117.1 hypothetical protein [bacterium]